MALSGDTAVFLGTLRESLLCNSQHLKLVDSLVALGRLPVVSGTFRPNCARGRRKFLLGLFFFFEERKPSGGTPSLGTVFLRPGLAHKAQPQPITSERDGVIPDELGPLVGVG